MALLLRLRLNHPPREDLDEELLDPNQPPPPPDLKPPPRLELEKETEERRMRKQNRKFRNNMLTGHWLRSILRTADMMMPPI